MTGPKLLPITPRPSPLCDQVKLWASRLGLRVLRVSISSIPGTGAIEAGVDTSLGVGIPVLAWSTSWTILGGRVQFLIAGPVVEVGVHRTTYLRGVCNPLVSGQLAWDGQPRRAGEDSPRTRAAQV